MSLKTYFSGLIRLEFDLGQGKIEFVVGILRARTAQNKPKLLDQVRDVIRRKHFSIRTEEAYTNWRVKAAPTR